MKNTLSYKDARDLFLSAVGAVKSERISLERAAGRILAEELTAAEDVPAFDRSPYDGYALRAADTLNTSAEAPVTLRILEEIPAGEISHVSVTEGTAVKVLTGSEIPRGADAVVMFEKTVFTRETVTLSRPVKSGENIVRAGEDVRKGTFLAGPGAVIDPGLAGTLAAQNRPDVRVYRVPRVGVLSTGHELLPPGCEPVRGKIINSSQYSLGTALEAIGCRAEYLGIAEDNEEEICRRLTEGLSVCDAVILTGGVSVGDYDLTPKAMDLAGVRILFQGVALKPGMACAYGMAGNRPVIALSGNPASALTNFYAVAVPALRKLSGCARPTSPEFQAALAEPFGKKSPITRLLRGHLDLTDGTARVHIEAGQGNTVLSSAIGCDVMAEIPAGSGPVAAGTKLTAFRI